MSNNDWYRYYAPRRLAELAPERMAADRAAAECDLDVLQVRPGIEVGDRILEIGCGWGRHALALARRGFQHVTSVDIAPEPLVLARVLASEAGLSCAFRQLDFLSVEDGPYDTVISLYDRSVCGFPTEAEDAHSLRHIAGLLRPGGWLVFGINDWPFHLPEARRDWHETAEGVELTEVLPDRTAMTCTDRVTLLRSDGRRERYTLTRRHYYLPELRRLLAACGFTLDVAVHRLLDTSSYGDKDEGLFVFARRSRADRLRAGPSRTALPDRQAPLGRARPRRCVRPARPCAAARPGHAPGRRHRRGAGAIAVPDGLQSPR